MILYCQKAYEVLLNIVDLEGSKVLDFGCGTGLLTERISDQASSVVAIDPSGKMISVLTGEHLNNVRAINGELTQELIDNDEVLRSGFDIIVASSAVGFFKFLRKEINLSYPLKIYYTQGLLKKMERSQINIHTLMMISPNIQK